MQAEEIFEYECPECGRGTVRTTRIHNYRTKIKGYPFVVDEAVIGVCEQCDAQSFDPEETKRWDELFARSLQARQAFLTPEEITQIRKDLGISMEDFARLIGSTRQSVSMWEKESRTTPPVRTADLLMKLVRQSLSGEPIDVLSFLLDEAKKWGVVIELRRPQKPPIKYGNLVLHIKQQPKDIIVETSGSFDLAAQATAEEEEPFIAENANGKQVGKLRYDYIEGALILDITEELPPWDAVDVEVETQDGQHFGSQALAIQEHRLILPGTDKLRENDIKLISLNLHSLVG